MLRVKLLADWKGNKADSILVVDNNEAFGLIDSGRAIVSKDMAYNDYKITKSDEEQADGKFTNLRTHNSK